MLEREPFKKTQAQTWLGHASLQWLRPGQPMEVGRVVTHLLDELYLLIQDVTETWICRDRTQRMNPR